MKTAKEYALDYLSRGTYEATGLNVEWIGLIRAYAEQVRDECARIADRQSPNCDCAPRDIADAIRKLEIK